MSFQGTSRQKNRGYLYSLYVIKLYQLIIVKDWRQFQLPELETTQLAMVLDQA